MNKIWILFFLIIAFSCNKKEINLKPQKKFRAYNSDRKKFVTRHQFDDFPVNKIEHKNPSLKLNTNVNSFSKRFKTMIKQSFEKNETNFAGKYIIDDWGCGSPCLLGIAIEVKKGKLIEIPPSSVGYKFQKDSRLLIVNPPDSLDYYISGGAYDPEVYYLDTIRNKFIKLED